MRDFDLRKLQLCELECLKEVDRLCRKHDIQYMLAWGSAIGAIRHKGFIPWDDDIDLLMKLDDYKRFKRVCMEELDPKFFYQDDETDPYYYLNFAKIRMNDTCSMMRDMVSYPIHEGICIDIFPMLEVQNDSLSKLDRYATKVLTFFGSKRLNDAGLGHHAYKNDKLKYFPVFLCDILHKMARTFLYRKRPSGEYYCVDGKATFDFFLPKSLFEHVQDVEFEGGMYPINTGYDAFLRSYYGDYMQIPDVEHQINHGDIIVDFEKSYKEYQKVSKL